MRRWRDRARSPSPGEALQAARLARLVTVELRQLEARYSARQRWWVPGRRSAKPSPNGPAAGHHRGLLDASYPPLPLGAPRMLVRRAGRALDHPGPNVIWAGLAAERRLEVSPAKLDEHEGDTMDEHRFVNMLSPSWSLR